MWYSIALYVHVLGAIGLFCAISLIVAALLQMRRASSPEQVREWIAVAQFAGKSIVFIALVILVPALYMVAISWAFTTPWVMAALIAFILLAVQGATVNGRMLERLAAEAAKPDFAGLRAQLMASPLWLAEGARVMLLVGIVYLMTMKPDLISSVVALVSALLLGLLLGALLGPFAERMRQRSQVAARHL
ncbi:MAG TPA: hypothetical protein VH349_08740 [Ktedonobacterales bacterium]|jgi:hypothetical protein